MAVRYTRYLIERCWRRGRSITSASVMSGSSHGSCFHSRSSSVLVRLPITAALCDSGTACIQPVLQHHRGRDLVDDPPSRLGAHVGLHHRLICRHGRAALVESHHGHAHNGSQRRGLVDGSLRCRPGGAVHVQWQTDDNDIGLLLRSPTRQSPDGRGARFHCAARPATARQSCRCDLRWRLRCVSTRDRGRGLETPARVTGRLPPQQFAEPRRDLRGSCPLPWRCHPCHHRHHRRPWQHP